MIMVLAHLVLFSVLHEIFIRMPFPTCTRGGDFDSTAFPPEIEASNLLIVSEHKRAMEYRARQQNVTGPGCSRDEK